MKTKIVSIDHFAGYCGYYTEETTVNNCYGCNHPECGDSEECYRDEDGVTHIADEEHPATCSQGKCFASVCPMCCYADEEVIEENDPELYNDLCGDDGEFIDSGDYVAYQYEDGDEIGERL